VSIFLRATLVIGVVLVLAACIQQDAARNARLGADALQVGDYSSAEGYLERALKANPADEYTLLNLGAVYEATDRQVLARETYAKIVRKNDLDASRRVVARRETGLAPLALAEARLIGLSAVEQARLAPAGDGYQRDQAVHEPGRSLDLNGSMDTVLERLNALDEAARDMSGALRQAATAAADEKSDTMAAETPVAPDAATITDEPLPPAEIVDAPLAIEADDDARPIVPQTVSTPPTSDRPSPLLQEAVAESRDQSATTMPMPLMTENPSTSEVERTEPMRLTNPEPAPEAPIDDDELEVIAAVDTAQEPDSFGESVVRVHLASYRNEETAERGWSVIRDQHRDVLEGMGIAVRRVDFGPDMGVYYRIHAGPIVDETEARTLCDTLKSRDQYCEVSFF
jgi:hypothetical protein